jgi:hypothetical protein
MTERQFADFLILTERIDEYVREVDPTAALESQENTLTWHASSCGHPYVRLSPHNVQLFSGAANILRAALEATVMDFINYAVEYEPASTVKIADVDYNEEQ